MIRGGTFAGLIGLAVAILCAGMLAVTPLSAAPGPKSACELRPTSSLCADEGRDAGGQGYRKVIKNAVNLLLYVVGVAAVVVIIYGGLRYVISAGNQSAVTGAKNAITYAVVGLLVAMTAYALVNFVLLNIG